jgi:hypothetical protein
LNSTFSVTTLATTDNVKDTQHIPGGKQAVVVGDLVVYLMIKVFWDATARH